MEKPNIHIKNKKASFNYAFIEKFVAGIMLTGTEIKSIRLGKANLVDSYCFFQGNELWVKGMNISEYDWGNLNNHVPKRDRKLLLKKKELSRLKKKSQENGMTIVAYEIFMNERGFAKLAIALAKGKKEYDKREDLKLVDAKREMDRFSKERR
jgi:SsrA-binding protein